MRRTELRRLLFLLGFVYVGFALVDYDEFLWVV